MGKYTVRTSKSYRLFKHEKRYHYILEFLYELDRLKSLNMAVSSRNFRV